MEFRFQDNLRAFYGYFTHSSWGTSVDLRNGLKGHLRVFMAGYSKTKESSLWRGGYVAQLGERWALHPMVAGSSPAMPSCHNERG